MRFDLNNYVDVQSRINAFWDKWPDGAIVTRLMSPPDTTEWCRYEAKVYADKNQAQPSATGFAVEWAGTSPSDGANFGSHEENSETSAIGRALANMGFAKTRDERPSQQEMAKVNRIHETYEQTGSAPRQTMKEQVQADTGDGISGKQIWFALKEGRDRGLEEDNINAYSISTFSVPFRSLSKWDAMKLIDAIKADQVAIDIEPRGLGYVDTDGSVPF